MPANEPPWSGRVLVFALHGQRPEDDQHVRRTLRSRVRRHRDQLARISGECAFDRVRGLNGVRYFEPRGIFLWGPFDYVMAYLADDVESVFDVATATGASAQEFLTGPLYRIPGEERTSAVPLLLADGQAERPTLVALARVKLGDHLVSCLGHSLRYAVWKRIREIADGGGSEAKTACVSLVCWGWPELVVLLMGDDARVIHDRLQAIEGITLGSLLGEQALAEALDSALEHSVPRGILSAWVRLEANDEPGTDTIRARIERANVVVSAPAQFGVFEDGRFPEGDGWSDLARVRDRAFWLGPSPDDPGGAEGPELPSPQALKNALKLTQPEASPGRPGLRASIRMLPKPGHLDQLRGEARSIASAFGGESRAVQALGGEGGSILLDLDVGSTSAEVQRLLALTLWLRVHPSWSNWLLDISTELVLRQDDSAGQPSEMGDERLWGYRCLAPPTTERARRLERVLLRRRRIGRVASLSLRSWMAAVEQLASRPDLFGSVAGLVGTVDYIRRDLHCPTMEPAELTQALRDWTRFGQVALQQVVQQTPAQRSAPSFQGEVPYALNQMSNLVAAVAKAVFAPVHHCLGLDPEDSVPSSEPLVVFGGDSSIAVRIVRGVAVILASVLQVETPLSLVLLFHELGHWMIAHSLPISRQRALDRALDGVGRSYAQAVAEVLKRQGLPGVEPDQGRRLREDAASFVEDFFCHAAWRRLGCGSGAEGLARFEFQILSAQAMGIRTFSEPETAQTTIEAWARTIVHVWLQQRLVAREESLLRTIRDVAGLRGRTRSAELRAVVDRAMPYLRGELAVAVGQFLGKEELATDDEVRNYLLSFIVLLWVLPLQEGSLQAWMQLDAVRPDDVARWAEEIRRDLVRLFESIDKVEGQVQVCEQKPGLQEQLAVLRSTTARPVCRDNVPSPPWTVLRPGDGEATLVAFLWVRSILDGAWDWYQEQWGRQDCKSLPRDPRNGVVLSGQWTAEQGDPCLHGVVPDAHGSLFVAGGQVRASYQEVRAAAMDALLDLADRMRSGQIRRAFRCRREALRWPYDEPVVIRCGDMQWSARLVDASEVSLGIDAPTGPQLLPLESRLTVVRGLAEVDCILRRRAPPVMGVERLGLSLADAGSGLLLVEPWRVQALGSLPPL